MIQAENPSSLGVDIFRRKPYLSIEMLQSRGTPHLMKNKVSDKFSRREVQFYDLYVRQDAEEDIARVKEGGFPQDIGADQYF
jgi:hypothetical protein